MKLSLAPIKAILARLLFAVHSIVGCYAVVQAYRDTFYWLLVFTLLGLAVETTFTMLRRGGKEWTWFSFASMCYLMSSLPSTWLLRIFSIGTGQTTDKDPCSNFTLSLIPETGDFVQFNLDTWTLALEQSQLIILTLGRWLLPQAELSRYQLAEQLLVYLGKAADILNLFELISDDALVTQHGQLIFASLGLWSWALLQYTYIIVKYAHTYDSGAKIYYTSDIKVCFWLSQVFCVIVVPYLSFMSCIMWYPDNNPNGRNPKWTQSRTIQSPNGYNPE